MESRDEIVPWSLVFWTQNGWTKEGWTNIVSRLNNKFSTSFTLNQVATEGARFEESLSCCQRFVTQEWFRMGQ